MEKALIDTWENKKKKKLKQNKELESVVMQCL